MENEEIFENFESFFNSNYLPLENNFSLFNLKDEDLLLERDEQSINKINLDIKPNNIQPIENHKTTITLKINKHQKNELNEDIYNNALFSNNLLEKNNLEINSIKSEEKKELSPKKLLGRKKKNSNEKGKHNKYSEDNIIRKCKTFFVNLLSSFINNFIYKIFNGNIGLGVHKKQLLKLNQNQIIDAKHNKQFLNKKLKDIFSEDISKNYSCFPLDYNKNLINILLNLQDEEKRIKFKNLFELTFLDCLKHFRGNNKLDILEGLQSLEDASKKFEDDKQYLKLFLHYIKNFEKIIMRKRSRQKNEKKI